jgi:hypothetical protein
MREPAVFLEADATPRRLSFWCRYLHRLLFWEHYRVKDYAGLRVVPATADFAKCRGCDTLILLHFEPAPALHGNGTATPMRPATPPAPSCSGSR